jgi:hypothetical protein
MNANNYVNYDFAAGGYAISGLSGMYYGVKVMTEPRPESFWAAETLAGAGIR